MKKLTLLTLTLVLIAAIAVTTANALEVEPSILVRGDTWISDIVFVDDRQLAYLSGAYQKDLVSWEITTTGAIKHSRALGLDVNEVYGGIAIPWGSNWRGSTLAYIADNEIQMRFVDLLNEADREEFGEEFGDLVSNDWFGQPPWHTNWVNSLAFKPEEYILASGSWDKTVRIWNFEDSGTPHHMFTLQGHTDWVNEVAWHPNRHILASASNDSTVRLWETRNGTYRIHLDHPDRGGVYSVAWHPDGSALVSTTRDGDIHLWNTEDLNNITYVRSLVTETHFLPHRVKVAFSPNGQTLASAKDRGEGRIRFWDTTTWQLIAQTPTEYSAYRIAFSPDGEILAGVRIREIEFSNDAQFDLILYRLSPSESPADGEGATDGETVGDDGETGETVADGEAFTDEAEDVPAVNINALITVLGREIADVNRDSYIDYKDLVIVAENYGKPVYSGDEGGPVGPKWADPDAADINKDGKVDVTDILIMIVAIDAAEAIGTPAAPPAAIQTRRALLQAADVRQWIRDAKAANADPAGIAALERLLTELNRRNLPVPKKTVLLANYPNPFNPETWIPYQLAKPAEVQVSIYSADGKLVRTLDLGQVPAGAYADKNRAAYWDGRNAQGEPVASGIYFYTLTAGEFEATRKMVIRK